MECLNKIKKDLSNNNKNKYQESDKKMNGIFFNKLLFFVFIFNLQISLSEEKSIFRCLNYDSEITLTVKGSGQQSIISEESSVSPIEVSMNGNPVDPAKFITLPDEETEAQIVMKFNPEITSCEKMFYGLENIISIDLSKFSTSHLENINSMFENCKDLEYINFNNIDTSKISNMKRLFSFCEKLKFLDLSNFDTSSAEDMLYMFYKCSSLEYLDLSKFKTSSVTNMNSMFYGCSQLTSINMPNFDTSSVKTMFNMFYGCSNLKSLDLSHFDTSSVENMDGMFRNCDNLEYINLTSFNTKSVTTMNQMFYNCKSLTSLDISNFETSKVKVMDNMFRGCNSLLSLNLSNFDTHLINSMSNMFNGCFELKSLDISNFNTASVKNMQFMFSDCKNLVSLDLSSFNTAECTSMKNMFYNCKSLESIDLSNFNTGSTTNMQYMFSGCENILSLDLSNFETSLVTRMDNMFSGCNSLIYLNLNSFSMNKIENTTDIFDRTSIESKFCIDGDNEKLKDELNSNNLELNCNDPCFEPNNEKIILEERECVENCDGDYPYEYNNICYTSCPRCTHQSSTVHYLCEKDLYCEEICEDYIYNDLCFKDIKEGYYLKDQTNKILDKCHKDCRTCEGKETSDSTNCKSCPSGKFLNFGNCTDNCKNGFNTDLSGNKICKCSLNDKCNECNKESYILDLCISCNDGFYQKLDDDLNDGGFINCYKTPEGYYLDLLNEIYKPCHPNCTYCYGEGNHDNHNCINCKEGYELNNDIQNYNNCYKKCDFYYYFDESNNYQCTERNECPENQNKLISEKNRCIDECKNDNIYKNEYNNLCYINCPNETIANNNICIKEEVDVGLEIGDYNEDQETDNSKTTNLETDEVQETDNSQTTNLETDENKETDNSQTTNLETDEEQETDNSQKTDLETDEDQETDNSQTTNLETDEDDQETDIDEKMDSDNEMNNMQTNKQEETEENDIGTIKESDKEIIQTQKSESDSILNCRAEDFFSTKSCGGTVISSSSNKDQLIENIQNDIVNHKIDDLIDNITQTKKDLVVQEKDTIFQITTTENQNNNEYKNMSTVKLGDCEDRLKNIYGIDKNLSLIIFKIDYYSEGLLIPIVGYEIFHPVNKSKLDLNYCKDILIELNIPVSIDEDNLFKYDPNSEYYTDECVPSTSENGTDIIINDRQNEYNSNNLSLCQNNCTFTGYESNTKKALCDCEVKTKINYISEIIDDKNILSNNFTSSDSGSSNIITMKCVYTLFTKEGLKSNIGSYILIFIIVLFSISSILFYKIGYPLLENDIKAIILEKGKTDDINQNNKVNIYNYNNKGKKKKKKKKKKKSKKGKNKIKDINNINIPPKKNLTRPMKRINSTKPNDTISNSKLKLKEAKGLFGLEKRKSKLRNTKFNINKNNIIIQEKQRKIELIKYNDFELNTLTYKEALLYDNRKFCQYYLFLIKIKNLILFAFVPIKDYNTIIIKICIFFLSFAVYYGVNAVFFDETTIHQIYEDGGLYNFVYILPKILYSFLIAHIISTIIKYTFLSERNILEIKRELLLNNAKEKVEKVKRTLVMKYIIFFVAGILFLIFFWYYLSSFGAVYQNTQIYLIKNTLISFVVALIYPFIINIIPGILRIISLTDNKQNRELLFKISKFLQYI